MLCEICELSPAVTAHGVSGHALIGDNTSDRFPVSLPAEMLALSHTQEKTQNTESSLR